MIATGIRSGRKFLSIRGAMLTVSGLSGFLRENLVFLISVRTSGRDRRKEWLLGKSLAFM